MPPLPLNTRRLSEKSFLLSLAIHALVLSLFVCVIPVLTQERRPEFIFLGSILQATDMLATDAAQTQLHQNQNDYTFASPQRKLSATQLEKPSTEKTYTAQEKQTLKTIYEEPPTSNKSEPMTDPETVDLGTPLEPYKPLRFKNK